MRDDQDLTRVMEDLDQSTRVMMNCMDEIWTVSYCVWPMYTGSYVIQNFHPHDREKFTGSLQSDSG